jgi:cyanate lyase
MVLLKELIHEEFGDGIMSAIDFSMNISREADPKGDRVKVSAATGNPLRRNAAASLWVVCPP